MRLAFVSDIHGNLAALDAVIDDLAQRQVDQVVNLGDTVSGPLLPRETVARLRGLPWLHIAGNHERQVLTLPPERQQAADAYASAQLSEEDKGWLRSHTDSCDPRLHEAGLWPSRLGPDVALCHGSPRSDLEYLLETPVDEEARLATPGEIAQRLDARIPPDIRLLACGHSHVPRVVALANGLLIVNPGSVGLPAYDDDHPLPLSRFHRIETGGPLARYAVAEKHGERWVVSLISLTYDAEPMALLAERNGRPDWGHALRAGWMART